MYHDQFGSKFPVVGQFTCRAVFVLGLIYAIVTVLGFLALDSPVEMIPDPYFTIMELLIILIAPLMAVSMVAVHYYASPVYRIYSLSALMMMCMAAALTTTVHFVVLSENLSGGKENISGFTHFFSFQWFSVAYALDILAWDWFFALSFLLASRVFRGGSIENITRRFMVISGALSLAGLAGVFTGNMQWRNIGIIGYAVIAPVVFLMIGRILGRLR